MTPEQIMAALGFGLAMFAVGWNMGRRNGILEGRLEQLLDANAAGTSTEEGE